MFLAPLNWFSSFPGETLKGYPSKVPVPVHFTLHRNFNKKKRKLGLFPVHAHRPLSVSHAGARISWRAATAGDAGRAAAAQRWATSATTVAATGILVLPLPLDTRPLLLRSSFARRFLAHARRSRRPLQPCRTVAVARTTTFGCWRSFSPQRRHTHTMTLGCDRLGSRWWMSGSQTTRSTSRT